MRIPVKFGPARVVVPLKSRVRLLPPPATPTVKVGVVPVRVTLALESVTAPV